MLVVLISIFILYSMTIDFFPRYRSCEKMGGVQIRKRVAFTPLYKDFKWFPIKSEAEYFMDLHEFD